MAAARIRRFLRLPSHDMALGAAAFVLLVAAVAGLKTLPYRTVTRIFGTRACRRTVPPDAVAMAILRAAPAVPRAKCLARGLAYVALARAVGAPGALVVGARRDARGAFEAHAWIEDGGRVVLGDNGDLASYARFRRETAGKSPA